MCDMKQIALTRGQVAIVDDEDFERLNRYKWHAQKHKAGFYACRSQSFPGLSKSIKVSMTRQIFGLCTEDSREIDHSNHKTLDNRKENLRISTRQQNMWNLTPRKSKSGFIGVQKKGEGRFLAFIVDNSGINTYLGTYDTAEQAADVRNKKALELRGDFAVLNKIA